MKNNGRVNIIGVKPDNNYNLFSKQIKSFPTSRCSNPNLGNTIANTPLSNCFFSKNNIQVLQNAIRYKVWNLSNKQYVIAPQSELQLRIIMRSVYLQYSKNLSTNISEQIQRLNKIVVNESVPNIMSSIKQYLGYRKEVSSLPVPLQHPKYMSESGMKTFNLHKF